MAARKRTPRVVRVKKVVAPRVPLAKALGDLHVALSIVATACDALEHAEDQEGSAAACDVGKAIVTLRHGVKALCRAYTEVDTAS